MYRLDKCILVTNNDRVYLKYRDEIKCILLDNYEDVYDSLDDEVASRLDATIVITLTDWAKKNSIYHFR